ncbi:MAG TPA: hypothetical protein VM096_16220 [Vicinamibacterales bacterium]|nr:hypothetical protein [Vicinamibacterales bacterium]
MALTSHRHREFVRHSIVASTGSSNPTRAQIVSSFNNLCDQLGSVLEPLFGRHAIDALFTRARHLASRDYPHLSTAVARNESRCGTDALDAVSASEAGDMLAALLAYKIDLLSTFVGEDLVMPLIGRAWAAPAARTATNQGNS